MAEYEVKVVRPTVHGTLGRLTPGQPVHCSPEEAVKYGGLLKLSKKEQGEYDQAKEEASRKADDRNKVMANASNPDGDTKVATKKKVKKKD